MKFIADFHIHSHFSRATSRELNFEQLHKWAQLKGVRVVGSGDLTHPGWLQEMKDKLEPAEEGLFRLKEEHANAVQQVVFTACQKPVRFILSGEISTIYKKHDKTRKVHHVVFLPSLEAVEKFQTELEKIGNIRSDGRPILGLDSHDLLEIVLGIDPQAYLIPAHIWTPWFSLFGSKSGFDTIKECFEELTSHIFAIETGLSSDPPMNWRLSALDKYTLVSNSDAHSPQKLAREANLFDAELSYPAIFAALKRENPEGFLGTIEFFPEEGKYHYDGHRKCNLRWEPKTTLQHNGLCPVCGKKVTVGVSHRVETLADRDEGHRPESASPFHSLIPLPEILGEIYNVGSTSKRVRQGYEFLLAKLGAELAILQEIPLKDIQRIGGEMLAEGIRRMRTGQVLAEAGYDGEFGVIKLFEKHERENLSTQLGLLPSPGLRVKKTAQPSLDTGITAVKTQTVAENTGTEKYADNQSANPASQVDATSEVEPTIDSDTPFFLRSLNPQQLEAAMCTDTSLIIAAGPGTGKTRTLTHRIAYLLHEQQIPPEQILAITFTNKAAEEMASRLEALLDEGIVKELVIKTFHAFCAMILREDGESVGIPQKFSICSERERHALLKQAVPDLKEKESAACLDAISEAKNQLLTPGDDLTSLEQPSEFVTQYQKYEQALRENHAVDFDDLLLLTVQLFEAEPEVLAKYQQRFRWISVDEYQDLNFAQYRVLKLLKTPEVNLCVIGDPDQAIYGFRGADRAYFLQFQQDFPDAKTLHLSQNYRSTQMIVNAARQVIAKSSERLPLEVWTEFVSQTKLDIYQASTYKAEAEYVVHEVEKMVGGTTYFSLDSGRVESHAESPYSFGDFAVLYRLGAQSHALQEAFQRSGIPYQIVGQRSLYEYKDVQEIVAYLWLLQNPASTFHLDNISKSRDDIFPFVQELDLALGTHPITHLLERIREFVLNGNIHMQEGKTDTPDDKAAERFRRLFNRATLFGKNLSDFLESTALQKEIDDYDPRADRVTMMTLHASKGLEFPVVFVVGCEETIIPYIREGRRCDFEEERRLFYVGMTRAQQKLILTHAKKRFLFGETLRNLPSRFLNDIEEALKELQERSRPKSKPKKNDSQLSLFG